MVKAVFIRSGSFKAALDLDKLTELPRRNFRKLLRIAMSAFYVDRDELETLKSYLANQVEITKTAWVQASHEYTVGWKVVVNKRARTVEELETLRNNRRLKAEVKRTKKAHEAAVGLKTIFEEECY